MAAPSSSAMAQGTTTQAGEWSPPEGVGGKAGQLQFETDIPFRAIAPHWSADPDTTAAVEISVSNDGASFSEPTVVGPATTDAGPPDRDGRTFGQLLMTGESRFVRYRGLDANGNQITIPGLTFTYIDAVGGPALGDISTASFPGTLSRPPIITRDQWGAALAYGGMDEGTSQWTPEYQQVEHIIIHHSDTPSFRDSLVEIRSIHYYHAVTRGWGDIGYNYLVDYLGNVFEGRKGGENVVGGHAYQYAYGSSGICSMGDFSLESSTPEAIGALVWISAWVARNLDPLGRNDFHETPNLPTICGHRDVNNSSCPGDALWADLPYIRGAVADVIAGSGDGLPIVSLAPGDVVRTVVSNANLRSKPAADAEIEATLAAGTVLTVVEGPTTNDGYSWYRVSGEESAGWLASIVFTASTVDPPAREYSNGDEVEVATNLLNIRNEPGLYGAIVATMTTGDTANVIGGPAVSDGITWIQVDSALGTGWVAADYIAPSGRTWINSSFAIGDTVEVDTNALSLRANASTGSSKIAVLWNGARGVVVDGPRRSTGFVWLKIEADAGTGWVAEQFLSEPSSDEESEGRFSIGDEVIIDTDALNLRSVGDIEGSVVSVAWFGTPATILDGPVTGDGYAWYRIETPARIGWVVDEFLAPADGFTVLASGFEPGTRIVVTTDALTLRSRATTAADAVAVLEHGTAGIVLEGAGRQDGHPWIKARFGDQQGYVATSFIGRSPGSTGDFATGTSVEVTSDNVNIRETASLNADVVAQAFAGDVLIVAGGAVNADGYTWINVRNDEWEGWAVSAWLTATSDAVFAVGTSVRIIDGELNLRSAPATTGDVVRLLPDGAIVEIVDGPKSGEEYTWYKVSSTRYGTGWAAGDWLARS